MSQSLSSILVHLVFSTKHREPLISPEMQPELYKYLGAIFRAAKSSSLSIGGYTDHVHILFALARTTPVASIVEEVKVASSRWLKTKGVQNFHWQSGYGAFSIGQSNVLALQNYIARQHQHHQRLSFQDEYRAFLMKYRVRFDEKYVWD
jgi:REP element-mobilizing transposase RayT